MNSTFVTYLTGFLDPVTWAKVARTHRSLSNLFAEENKEFWEKCVRRDISNWPKPRVRKKFFKEDRIETYKEMYARVYSVILEIKLSKDRSTQHLFQLFFKILDHGFEKFDTHFPHLFSSAVINTTFTPEPSTFLNFAAQRGYTDLLQYILRQGAGVNTVIPLLKALGTMGVPVEFAGKSALMYAVKANQTRCVSILIEARADVDYKTSSWDTALHKAARKKYTDCVKILLEARASTNMTNVWGRSALDVAPKNSQCRQLLTEAVEKSKKPIEPAKQLVMR